MDWEQWLRLLVVIAMVLGAWQSIKAMGKPVRVGGRRYYRQPDGSYRNFWGGRIKDPAVLAALAAMDAPGADAPPRPPEKGPA